MANHKSAKKRMRQSENRRIRNRSVRSRMRNSIKRAREALASGADNKAELVKHALSEISRAASKNVLKKGTASRYMARLTRASSK